ncbi:MAG: hypothetical protein M3364_05030 [Actinomycetota bacterium]|nr:hypothetical protein [Actinomycetota bacterium]
MRIPRADDPREAPVPIAAADAAMLWDTAVPLVEEAKDVEWYDVPGSEVDRAASALCRLRRASAGRHGGPQHGDEAVRNVLASVSPEAVVWLASRAISYMDEYGFPEAVAPWIPDEDLLEP